MNVPLVVHTTSVMIAHIATLGPAVHSHQDRPSRLWVASQPGGASGSMSPALASATWMIPRGSENHFGPSTPNALSNALTAPPLVNRNRNTTLIATELVTDGK